MKFVLVVLVVIAGGCSRAKNNPASSTEQSPFGTIIGKVQIALGSGDVKPVAFKSVRLTEESFAVLSDSEKQDIVYDADEGSEAVRLGVTSMDEHGRKVQAKVNALQSFDARLPQKQAIPTVSIATTDAGGNFKFEGIKPGTYWVFLDTTVSGNQVGWAVKVDVARNSVTNADMNNTNLDYGFR